MNNSILSKELNRSKVVTQAELLRKQLVALEMRVGQLGRSSQEEALQIPAGFDRAAALLETLRSNDAAILSEAVRFETVSAQFKRKAALFLQKIGGREPLRTARERAQPVATAWWWYVDTLVAERRTAQWRRWGRNVVIGLVVLALLVVGYRQFLAPSPELRASFAHQDEAEFLMREGEYAAALAEVKAALVYTPDAPRLLVMRGVFEELLGEIEASEASYAKAAVLYADQEELLVSRGQLNLQLNRVVAARRDAEALIALNPDSAEGYYFLGLAEEATGTITQALVYYERAGDLARAAEQSELYVMIRMQLSQALQSGMLSPASTPSAEQP